MSGHRARGRAAGLCSDFDCVSVRLCYRIKQIWSFIIHNWWFLNKKRMNLMEIVPNIRFTTSFSGSRVPQAFSWRAYMAFRELWACPCPPSLSAAEVFRVLRHVRRRILKWFRKYSKYMELHVCSIPKEKIHPYELTITVIRARTQPIRRDSTNRTKTHLVIDPQILNILKFKFFNFFSLGNNLFESGSKPWPTLS